jgi:SAM-dependent methyltransferase
LENKFGDGIDWGEASEIWIKSWDTDKAFPKPDIEHNWLVNPMPGLRVKDYITTGSKELKAVDLGCNYGSMIYTVIGGGYDYTGIEQSKRALEIATKLHPDIKFLNMLLWDINIREEFDLAFTQAVLQHNTWAEQERIIPKIHGLLKPGGVFIFTESTVRPEQAVPNMNARTNQGWIDLMTRHGFKFEKTWGTNDQNINNIYLFTKPKE